MRRSRRSRKGGRPPASAASTSATDASSSGAPATVGGEGWEDLPEGLLLSVLERLPSLADLCAFAGVCRCWRALADSPAIGGGRPPLLLSPVIDDSVNGKWVYPRHCRLLSPVDPAASYRCLLRPGTLTSHVVGYSHGHLISCRGRRPLLANVASGEVIHAPELPPHGRVEHGVLTAPLSAPNCSLLLLCEGLWPFWSSILQWRVGDGEWSVHLRENHWMPRITVFKGQIFTLDHKGNLFTVEFSPHFSVRKLAVQDWSRFGVFELVECGGELMLVHFANANSVFTIKVMVFRFDSSSGSWVKVESLGEAALFMELEHGSSVSCPNASRWGTQSNCVYLARRPFDSWTVVPLDGNLTAMSYPKLPWPLERADDTSLKWPSPVWVFPSTFYKL